MRVVVKPGGIVLILIALLVVGGVIFQFRPKSTSTDAAGTSDTPPAASGNTKSTPVDLARLFNADGIYTDGTKVEGKGIDGIDAGLSGTLLGTSQTWNKTTFTIGAPNGHNILTSQGQQIALPAGKYSDIYMLAFAAGSGVAPSGAPFTATYADGSTTPFSQGISDWFKPQNFPGEATAVTMPYRNRGAGLRQTEPFYLYGYKFHVDNTKTIKSFTLPNDPSIKIVAITLGQ